MSRRAESREGTRRVDAAISQVSEARPGESATPGVSLVPLEPEIAVESTRLQFAMHADPADRMLVATARQLGATLVTADRALLGVAAKGHFRAMDAGK